MATKKYTLKDHPDIGKDFEKKLTSKGIKDFKTLLEKGLTDESRGQLANDLKIPEWRVTNWVRAADMMRVPGMKPTVASMFVQLGIGNVQEVARFNIPQVALYIHYNGASYLPKGEAIPTEKDISGLAAAAKSLPPMIERDPAQPIPNFILPEDPAASNTQKLNVQKSSTPETTATKTATAKTEAPKTNTPDHKCYITITTPQNLPDAVPGKSYKFQLKAEHCGDANTPIRFGHTNALPPEWLSISEDGWLTGTPAGAGTSQFSVAAYLGGQQYPHNAYTEKGFGLTVAKLTKTSGAIKTPKPDEPKHECHITIITPQKLPDAVSGKSYQVQIKAEHCGDANTSFYFAFTDPLPPEWLFLNEDGWLTATPDAAGTITFSVGAYLGGQQSPHNAFTEQRFSLTVTPAVDNNFTVIQQAFDGIKELLGDNSKIKGLPARYFGRAVFIKDAGEQPAAGIHIKIDGWTNAADDKGDIIYAVSGADGSFAFNMPGKYNLYNMVTLTATNGSATEIFRRSSSELIENEGDLGLLVLSFGFGDAAQPSPIRSRFLSPPSVFSSFTSSSAMGVSGGEGDRSVDLSSDDSPSMHFSYSLLHRLIEPDVYHMDRSAYDLNIENKDITRSKLVFPVDVTDFKNNLFQYIEKIPRMKTLGMGYVLKMSQSWKPDGFALGTLLYSLVLAPGEQQRLVIRERSESYTVTDTDDSAAAISETYDFDQSDNITAIYNQAVDQYDEGHSKSVVKSKGWSIGGSAGGGAGGVMLGISGGYSNTKTTTTLDTQQSHSLDTASSAAQTFQRLIKGAAERLTQAKRVGIRMATASESDSVSTKLISNHNHSHSLTMQYWEVVRKYRLETCVDEVSLVVYVPMQLIEFLPYGVRYNEVVIMDLGALIKKYKERFEKESEKSTYAGPSTAEKYLLDVRYSTLLKYHDVLKAYLPSEHQRGLSLLQKFSALPRWDLEKTGSDTKETTLTIKIIGSFMPYDRVSASLRLKNGRVIPGYQNNEASDHKTQNMPKQKTTRNELYRALEDLRRNTRSGRFTFDFIIPPGVIDDDYDCITISNSYDSSITYQLHQTDEAKQAYKDYKNKMYNSVQDNKQTAYDLMKAGFHEIEAESVMQPIVTMDAQKLRSFGPPILDSVVLIDSTETGENTSKAPATPATGSTEKVLASGMIKLDPSFRFTLYDDSSTLRCVELQKIEMMLRHILENGIYYSQAVWASLTADERALLFEKYTIEMPASDDITVSLEKKPGEDQEPDIQIAGMSKIKGSTIPLMNCVINQPLGFYGNCMVLPFVYPPKLAETLGTTSGALQDALYRYHTQAFRVPTTTISLPTTGMMGDAILGKNNASEKIDLTRFWNWSDSPIPETDRISPDYFKETNLLDNRSAPASSLPTGNVTTMPISDALLDTAAATNILKSMIEKSTPQFSDLSGYEQMQAMTSSESAARTQLAQQSAATTQKAIDAVVQQQTATQQADMLMKPINMMLEQAVKWRKEAMDLELQADALEKATFAADGLATGAAIGATAGTAPDASKISLPDGRPSPCPEVEEMRARAVALRKNAAELEKKTFDLMPNVVTALASKSSVAKPSSSDSKPSTDAAKPQTSEGSQATGGGGKTTERASK